MRAIMLTADSLAEHAAIGHLRGWCHDGRECPICQAEARARAAEARLESVITG